MELIKMTKEQYAGYRSEFIDSLGIAYEKNCAMNRTNAVAAAESHLNDTLPNGLYTKDHDLFMASQDGNIVGSVWVAWYRNLPISTAYIYDLRVISSKRGQGFGRVIINCVEQLAQELSMKQMLLHVFHSNQNAFRFYTQRAGFEMQSSFLRKSLKNG